MMNLTKNGLELIFGLENEIRELNKYLQKLKETMEGNSGIGKISFDKEIMQRLNVIEELVSNLETVKCHRDYGILEYLVLEAKKPIDKEFFGRLYRLIDGVEQLNKEYFELYIKIKEEAFGVIKIFAKDNLNFDIDEKSKETDDRILILCKILGEEAIKTQVIIEDVKRKTHIIHVNIYYDTADCVIKIQVI